MCEHLHLPLQSGSDRTLARMHRGYTAERYLERLAAARAAIPDLAVTTDIIVGFPGETDADFARTLEVVDAAAVRRRVHVRVLAPARHARRPTMTDDFVAPEVAQERMSRLTEVVERHALAQARGARRAHRGGPGRGAVEERPDDVVGPHPPEQARALRRRACTSPRSAASCRRPRHPRRAALAARRPARHGARPPAGPHPHPRHRRACVTAPHLAIVGPTASGKSALALEVARAFGDVEIVSLDSMQVYRGLDIGTAKPTAGRARRGRRTTWSTWPIPTTSGRCARFQHAARAAIADIEARGQRALLVGGTGLYVRAVDRPAHDPAARTATVRDARSMP